MSDKKKIIYNVKKLFKSPTDPDGSYTGTQEKGEKPVQDADDL